MTLLLASIDWLYMPWTHYI